MFLRFFGKKVQRKKSPTEKRSNGKKVQSLRTGLLLFVNTKLSLNKSSKIKHFQIMFKAEKKSNGKKVQRKKGPTEKKSNGKKVQRKKSPTEKKSKSEK